MSATYTGRSKMKAIVLQVDRRLLRHVQDFIVLR
jgi:hypothetical protein